MSRVSQAHSFLVIKYNIRNLNRGRRKDKWPKVSYGDPLRSLKQRSLSWGRWPGSLSSPVYLFEITWMPLK